MRTQGGDRRVWLYTGLALVCVSTMALLLVMGSHSETKVSLAPPAVQYVDCPKKHTMDCPTCSPCNTTVNNIINCDTNSKENNNKNINSNNNNERPPTLVVYVYSEAAFLFNFVDFHLLFKRHGYCEKCTNIDFAIVTNGPVSYSFPTHDNLRVYPHDDACAAGDFGAWDFLLNKIDRKKYKRLMFINDTVKGPFYDPAYLHIYGPNFHFTDIFATLMSNETRLVGSYINCGGIHGKGPGKGHSHVQTMAWMTDDVGLEILRPLIKCYYDKYEAIFQGEIGFSKRMIESGYNIGSMLFAYRGVDFRKNKEMRDNCNEQNDSTFTGNYFGQSIHPLEVMFFKTSREGGNWPIIDLYSRFMDEMGKNPVK